MSQLTHQQQQLADFILQRIASLGGHTMDYEAEDPSAITDALGYEYYQQLKRDLLIAVISSVVSSAVTAIVSWLLMR